MGLRDFLLAVFIIGSVHAQTYRVCISSTNTVLCQSLDRDGSQAVCESVESRIDCAIKLARGEADIGVFSEEEMILLSQQQPNDNRVVASIRDVARTEPFAFEAVAVVPASNTGGFEGLRGGQYCHPGFDQTDLRWSPRVLKTFEQAVARSDRCPGANTDRRTAEELEVETLSQFFGSACRPGPWSSNTSVDTDLRNRFPSLCSLCGVNANCSRYTIDMGISISGVNSNNRHIQALECMRSNNVNSTSNNAVAYVAWQHVREFFNLRNPQDATSYALLCEDGSIRVLTTDVLASATAPCSFVKQPWSGIVATASRAAEIQTNLRQWWPNGANPGGNTWQNALFGGIIGGDTARVVFEETIVTPLNYTQGVRNFTTIDASSSCIPARRWCTISTQELAKCSWLRTAAHTLGIQPAISCQQRNNVFECLSDIRDGNADFIASAANYGFLSRQHYRLTAVKLVQNSRSNAAAFSRVAALLLDSTAQSEITRFENLRGTRACFPEFSGISYVAFVQVAHERGIISSTECDYMKSVGEFFGGSCAPGAMDASHTLTDTTYNATNLCTVCRPSVNVAAGENFTCAFDYTNMYYGNNGTLRCLADPSTHVAFVELHNIEANLQAAGLQASQVRALCRNNTLAANTGVSNIDQNCLLAYVVDSEVITRRNDPLTNSLNTLLDTLDLHFGYNAATSAQLINLEMYSPFDGVSDLLFKNTAVGLSEPSSDSANEAARNYNELFRHLESCTGAASMPGMGSRNLLSFVTLLVTMFITRFVLY